MEGVVLSSLSIGWLSNVIVIVIIIIMVTAFIPENPLARLHQEEGEGGTKLFSYWLAVYCPAQRGLLLAERAIVFGT